MGMRYSLVKVPLTVSLVRPSFLQPPAVHPENDRFFTPLFSVFSELLFSQPLCFHNHLRCPLVFSNRALHEPTAPASSPKSFLPRAKARGIYRFLAPSQTEGYAICRFNGPTASAFRWQTLYFHTTARSLRSFSRSFSLFSMVCGLFCQNTRVWVPLTESKPQLASHNVRSSGLQSRTAAHSSRRLCDSAGSFDA
jgi:hypothetical protein